MNKLLPIGSVVILKNNIESIMITGYYIENNNDNKIYDYSGYLMPIGCVEPQKTYYFNQCDIKNILFIGYQSYENIILQEKISEVIKSETTSPGESLLPIGSIVKLKRGFKKIMIFGYFGTLSQKVTDYIGCDFPKGYNNKTKYYFNASDIDIIYFVGPQNKEQELLARIITDCMEQYKKGLSLFDIVINIEAKYNGQDTEQYKAAIKEIKNIVANIDKSETEIIYQSKTQDENKKQEVQQEVENE